MTVSVNFWLLIQKQVLSEMKSISSEDKQSLESTKSHSQGSKVSLKLLPDNLKILIALCFVGLQRSILLRLSLELQRLLT